MRLMEFNVNAVVGGNVIAHGRGETLKAALADFEKKQRENAEEYADLQCKALRSVEEAVA